MGHRLDRIGYANGGVPGGYAHVSSPRVLDRILESDKGLLLPGRAIGLLDLELELEFLQSNQPLPMGVICGVELL